jgi:hypothetical protein
MQGVLVANRRSLTERPAQLLPVVHELLERLDAHLKAEDFYSGERLCSGLSLGCSSLQPGSTLVGNAIVVWRKCPRNILPKNPTPGIREVHLLLHKQSSSS